MDGFVIQKEEFEEIVKKSKHLKTLFLSRCTMDFDDKLDFGEDLEYRLKNIDFFLTGNSSYSNWSDNFPRFERIIDAISRCSLKKSLKQIGLSNCHTKVNTPIDFREQYGITKIRITEDV